MKALFKTQTLQTIPEQVQAHINGIDSECKNFIETNVKRLAKSLGQDNLPPSNTLQPYTNEIDAFFDTKITTANIFLQGLTEHHDEQATDDTITEKKEIIESLKKHLRNTEEEVHDITIERDVHAHRTYTILLYVFGIFESIWVSNVLTFLGDSTLIVLIGGLIVAFSLVMYFKYITLHVRDSKHLPWYQKVVIPIFSLAVLVSIGLLRYIQIQISASETEVPNIPYANNPFVFGVLSALPAIATILITHRFILSSDEKKKKRQHDTLSQEIADIQSRIAQLTQEVHHLLSQKKTAQTTGTQLANYTPQIHAHIESYRKQALSIFVTENMRYRTSRATPFNGSLSSIAFLSLGVSGLLSACSPPKPTVDENHVAITVAIDITDTESYQTTARDLLVHTIADHPMTDAFTITIQSLSQYHVNELQIFTLPKESFLLGNEYKRRKKVEHMVDEVDQAIALVYQKQGKKQRSNLFAPLITAANRLAQTNAATQHLVVISDLAENGTFSCYKKSDLRMLQQNPEAVEKLLLKGTNALHYPHLTVHISHQPRSQTDDEVYAIMAQFVKDFFEKQGATVEIGATL
ncbi:MAG: hypothetical protein K1X55_13180 [Chitinophagales bacterium]|nr:hypothetical protein [Chitinophagales bacterium]